MPDEAELLTSDTVIANIRAELEKASPNKRKRILEAVAIAALGAIPWVGGVLSAAATFRKDEGGVKSDDLRNQWLEEHEAKLRDLRATLQGIFERLESLGDGIYERIESREYLMLVRKTFREWDQADTEEKRALLVQLITHAAGTRVCSDDILRLFVDWIELYHEAHFGVIRAVYKESRSTRLDIWKAVYGPSIPRDDSAEADLYKMLIRDLSTGGVIRQARESDAYGRFYKKKSAPSRRLPRSSTMETAFEDSKEYVLTEMGKQFVHYTMNELVARIESPAADERL